jgi:hypothetical protein
MNNRIKELMKNADILGLIDATAVAIAKNCSSVPNLTHPHLYFGIEDLLTLISSNQNLLAALASQAQQGHIGDSNKLAQPIIDTDSAREFLIANVISKFSDSTFQSYVRNELAGDFAYQLARYFQAQYPSWLLKSTQDLAVHMWQKHYKAESPVFEVLNDLAGVISQIDNMTTGLVREQPQAQQLSGNAVQLQAQDELSSNSLQLPAQEPILIYKQALIDIQNPIVAMKRDLPEGYSLNGHAAIAAHDNPQTYKDIAAKALRDAEAQQPAQEPMELEALRKKLETAVSRINDMLESDDGQAHKEARKFIESLPAPEYQELESKGG